MLLLPGLLLGPPPRMAVMRGKRTLETWVGHCPHSAPTRTGEPGCRSLVERRLVSKEGMQVVAPSAARGPACSHAPSQSTFPDNMSIQGPSSLCP